MNQKLLFVVILSIVVVVATNGVNTKKTKTTHEKGKHASKHNRAAGNHNEDHFTKQANHVNFSAQSNKNHSHHFNQGNNHKWQLSENSHLNKNQTKDYKPPKSNY